MHIYIVYNIYIFSWNDRENSKKNTATGMESSAISQERHYVHPRGGGHAVHPTLPFTAPSTVYTCTPIVHTTTHTFKGTGTGLFHVPYAYECSTKRKKKRESKKRATIDTRSNQPPPLVAANYIVIWPPLEPLNLTSLDATRLLCRCYLQKKTSKKTQKQQQHIKQTLSLPPSLPPTHPQYLISVEDPRPSLDLSRRVVLLLHPAPPSSPPPSTPYWRHQNHHVFDAVPRSDPPVVAVATEFTRALIRRERGRRDRASLGRRTLVMIVETQRQAFYAGGSSDIGMVARPRAVSVR